MSVSKCFFNGWRSLITFESTVESLIFVWPSHKFSSFRKSYFFLLAGLSQPPTLSLFLPKNIDFGLAPLRQSFGLGLEILNTPGWCSFITLFTFLLAERHFLDWLLTWTCSDDFCMCVCVCTRSVHEVDGSFIGFKLSIWTFWLFLCVWPKYPVILLPSSVPASSQA